jgi:hypothetical protein
MELDYGKLAILILFGFSIATFIAVVSVFAAIAYKNYRSDALKETATGEVHDDAAVGTAHKEA